VSPTVTGPSRHPTRVLLPRARPPCPARTPALPDNVHRGTRWYAVGTVIGLFRLLFDLVLAFVAPRAALVAENLILRQQLIVVRRQIKRPSLAPIRSLDHQFVGRPLPPLAGRRPPRETRDRHRLAPYRLALALPVPPGPSSRRCRAAGTHPADMAREPYLGSAKIIAAELAKLGYQSSHARSQVPPVDSVAKAGPLAGPHSSVTPCTRPGLATSLSAIQHCAAAYAFVPNVLARSCERRP
jgi:hypothetical protein